MSLAKGCENTLFWRIGNKEQEARIQEAVRGGRRGGEEGVAEKKELGEEEEVGHLSEGNADITSVGLVHFWCLVFGGCH